MSSIDSPATTVIPAAFPKKCRAIFEKLAKPLPIDALPALREEMRLHLLTAQRHLGPAPINLPLIERMTTAMEAALNSYEPLSEGHRGLLVGAVRYFIENADAANDLEDPLGFDDDLAVMNAVLLEIGLAKLMVAR
ncbi:MAG TPA: hypothetical protein PKM25_04690 [Candidatus Ozemobacteraceae bacterium]|nr:hypothetical protein [Candidatus Ozemobacteraceae bacterium]